MRDDVAQRDSRRADLICGHEGSVKMGCDVPDPLALEHGIDRGIADAKLVGKGVDRLCGPSSIAHHCTVYFHNVDMVIFLMSSSLIVSFE